MTISPTTYNGLAVFYSAQNRYDKENGALNSGPVGYFVHETLIEYGYNPHHTFFSDDYRVIPSGTKSVILCGAQMAKTWFTTDADLSTVRGHVRLIRNMLVVATFNPVDCVDIKDFENVNSDDDDDDAGSTGKDTAPTQRGNYRFWFKADLRKLLKKERLTHPVHNALLISPNETIAILRAIRNQILYFDIETHPDTETLQCFSFAVNNGPVYTVPVYGPSGAKRCDLKATLAALARALSRNTVVIHNSFFDLGFLAHFHGVPFGEQVYDTMLAHHRFFPESEKSLAHAISYWINAPYHKSESGTFHPRNEHQFQTLLEYNAKDVATLRAVYLAQQSAIPFMRGIKDSITQVNASIYPYLMAGLTGFNVNDRQLSKKQADLNNEVEQMIRAFRILVGNKDFLLTSNKYIGEWLYEGLQYPILSKTDNGAPQTDAKTLYRLLVKNPRNVALKLLLLFKEKQKAIDMLGFEQYYILENRL